MATTSYNPAMSPYLAAKLAAASDTTQIYQPTQSGQGGSSLWGDAGAAALGFGGLAAGKRGLKIARSAWTGRNATPQQALADSGNAAADLSEGAGRAAAPKVDYGQLADTRGLPAAGESSAASPYGVLDKLGERQILQSTTSGTGQSMVQIVDNAGNLRWVPAGPGNVSEGIINTASEPFSVSRGSTPFTAGADGVAPLADAAAAYAPGAVEATLGTALKGSLGPASVAMIAGGDQAPGSMASDDAKFAKAHPGQATKLLDTFQKNLANGDGDKGQLAQRIANLQTGLGMTPANGGGSTGISRSQAPSFSKTVDQAAQDLAQQLASNGIDPNGSVAQGMYKDLNAAAIKISKAGGKDAVGALQQYADSISNNINTYSQAQQFQAAYPKASQTAYMKMSVNLMKPYVDQMQQQAESSSGQLLQLATAAAHRGDPQSAQMLMQQAQQVRSDASAQALQYMTLAANTPRMAAYQKQISTLNSQLAQANAKNGTTNTAEDVFAQQFGG